jgi:hypothetical protein
MAQGATTSEAAAAGMVALAAVLTAVVVLAG